MRQTSHRFLLTLMCLIFSIASFALMGYDAPKTVTISEGKYKTPYGYSATTFDDAIPASWTPWYDSYTKWTSDGNSADAWPLSKTAAKTTGTYSYVNYWSGDDPDLPIYYRVSTLDPTHGQFMIEYWGAGNPIIFDYNTETGIIRLAESYYLTENSNYGSVYVSDAIYYWWDIRQHTDLSEYPEYQSYYDKETGKFYLRFAYWVSAGVFGHDYETFQCDDFYVEINGIFYNVNKAEKTAEVTNGNREYSGSITIPSSITYNGVECSVTSIGGGAFEYSSNLTSITIPNSVTSIGQWAFAVCSALTSINIPNSVTSIGGGAFQQCSNLTSITIPNSVTSIGGLAFLGCTSLSSINVDSYNNNYCSTDGVLFNKQKTELICYPAGKTESNYSIPNSVTSIRGYAFQDCTSLTSITIPNSVTSIGESAFTNCSSLTSINIPNSVTSIGKYAFWCCIYEA